MPPHVEEALADVLGHPHDEAEKRVDVLCRRYPEHALAIRRGLASLRALGLCGTSLSGLASIPDQLGDYRILEQLGSGGMGIVYRAAHAETGKEVALKILRPAYTYFPGTRLRFLREMQTVARLEHHGIASVLDSGESEGVPFFVTKLIRGASLSEVIATHAGRSAGELRGVDFHHAILTKLGVPVENTASASMPSIYEGSWNSACVRILSQVADALAYAHDRGVVHRDIKPSNILIDTEGTAQLIDFGLASTPDASKLTMSGSILGSLPYMAPELLDEDEASSTGDACPEDTESEFERRESDPSRDIYALGVSLWEALALHCPFRRTSIALTRANILEAQLPRLRDRNPSVPRTLAAICETAMHRLPARRYASAREFGAQMRNWQQGSKVHVSKPRLGERVAAAQRRLPRRAGAIATAALAVGIGVYGYGAWRDVQASANETARVLSSELSTANALGNLPLDAERAQKRLGKLERLLMQTVLDTDIKSEIRALLGQGYMSLARLAEAKRTCERALAELRKRDASDARVLEASLALAKVNAELGHTALAGQLQRSVIHELRASERVDPIQVAMCESDLAAMRFAEAKTKDLVALARKSLATLRAGNASGIMLARAERNLMVALQAETNQAEVRELAESATRRFEEVCGPQHLETIRTREAFAGALAKSYRLDEAEKILARCLEIKRKQFGADHPVTIKTMTTLAVVLFKKGDFGKSRRMLEHTVNVTRRAWGREWFYLGTILTHAGAACQMTGDRQKALEYLEEACEIEETHGSSYAISEYVSVLHNTGQRRRAAEICKDAIAKLTPCKTTTESWHRGRLEARYADILLAAGDHDTAATLAESAHKRIKSATAYEDTMIFQAALTLATCAFKKAQYGRAHRICRRTLSIMRHLFPRGNLTCARLLVAQADALVKEHRSEAKIVDLSGSVGGLAPDEERFACSILLFLRQAERMLVDIERASSNAGRRNLAMTRLRIAVHERTLDRHDKARAALASAGEIFASLSKFENAAQCYTALARWLDEAGEHETAKKLRTRSQELLELHRKREQR